MPSCQTTDTLFSPMAPLAQLLPRLPRAAVAMPLAVYKLGGGLAIGAMLLQVPPPPQGCGALCNCRLRPCSAGVLCRRGTTVQRVCAFVSLQQFPLNHTALGFAACFAGLRCRPFWGCWQTTSSPGAPRGAASPRCFFCLFPCQLFGDSETFCQHGTLACARPTHSAPACQAC